MTVLRFRVRGMDCAEEVGVLRQALRSMVGDGGDIAFDVLNGRMIITPGRGASDQAAVIAAVRATGMTAEPWAEAAADGVDGEGTQQRGRTLLTAVSGVALGLGFGYHAWRAGGVMGALGSEGMGLSEGVPTVAALLYTVSIVAGAWYVLP